MKKPGDCQNIQEIRSVIDEIDREILDALARRHEYVEEIVKFKKDNDGIVAMDRQLEVFRKRREWAKEFGLDQDLIEEIYKMLINWNVQKELEIFRSKEQSKI